MRALGIPKEMFTVMFAMGRTVGWLAHWTEMVDQEQVKITRPRQWYVGAKPRSVCCGVSKDSMARRKMTYDTPSHFKRTKAFVESTADTPSFTRSTGGLDSPAKYTKTTYSLSEIR
eukprot:Protomagalhaensia_wolfi_Nauph_80__4630@NODE_4789_length_505_cov_713_787554_g3054_i1_p1_GENE_NODE_4789_length_505_cov_713_787554_g3054_i1NODE_4789_length_505_cov_713_787554_g3054_i1_p1_ORF_typecomplete_len127_score7_65Citrate_synt/PF00285_21/1_5e18_NODE_4789_length_505_cov_713_787554_g3054_i1124471